MMSKNVKQTKSVKLDKDVQITKIVKLCENVKLDECVKLNKNEKNLLRLSRSLRSHFDSYCPSIYLPSYTNTKKFVNSKKLKILLKRGTNTIYLSEIVKNYQRVYGFKPFQKDVKSDMLELGYVASLDVAGKIFYNSVEFTNHDSGNKVTKKLTNFDRLKMLLNEGTGTIYLSEIERNYQKVYGLKPFRKDVRSYMSKIGYIALFDVVGKTFYNSIEFTNHDNGNIVTKKLTNFDKLKMLLRDGTSTIYLSEIEKNYQEVYGLKPFRKDIRLYMSKIGYVALLDAVGKTFYNLIEFTNHDSGNIVIKKLTNFDKLKMLLKDGTSTIYLSEIEKNYQIVYGLKPFRNDIKSYISKIGYVALLDVVGRTFYNSIEFNKRYTNNKVIKKLTNFHKLRMLLKEGTSIIYLSEIEKNYQMVYGLKPFRKDIRSYMLKIGYVALLDIVGRTFYNSIEFTKRYTDNRATKELTNFDKLEI